MAAGSKDTRKARREAGMACIDFEPGLSAKHDSDSKMDGKTQIKSTQVKSAQAKSVQAKFTQDGCRAANPPHIPVDCAGGASCGRDSPANTRPRNTGLGRNSKAKQRR
jgi:hypothetical protein